MRLVDGSPKRSSFFGKVLKALRHPGQLAEHIRFLTDPGRVHHVQRGGEWFYKYRGCLYPDYLNHGNAGEHIRELALRYCHGRGIDIGADRWPFPGAVPVYNEARQNAYKLDDFAEGSLDYVHSSHCLEHLERWQEALRLWTSKLKPGGYLFLYLPHRDMKLWNPGSPWVGDGHKWQPTSDILNPFIESLGLHIVDFGSQRDHYWSFHIVAKK